LVYIRKTPEATIGLLAEDQSQLLNFMFEVSFRIQHDCPYVQFSLKHPDVRIVGWCKSKMDVLEIKCPNADTRTKIEEDLHSLLSWIGRRRIVKNISLKNPSILLIAKPCPRCKIGPGVVDIVERHHCITASPMVCYGGWEEHRTIGFSDNDYRHLFRDLSKLGPIEILHKRNLDDVGIYDAVAISVNGLFSDLTIRQTDAIRTAVESGYYDVPRKMNAEDIANRLRVPRTTFDEHLRKAESKIFHVMAPYIKMQSEKPRKLRI